MKLILENWRKYLGEQEDISPVTKKPYPRNLSPEKKKEYDDWASNKTFDPTAVGTGGDTPLQKAVANKKAVAAQAGDVAQLKTVGDLRKAIAVAARLKKSQAGKEAVKGTAMGLALGALGEIPGFSLAAAGAGAAKDIAGLVKSVYQLPDDKETNTALDALNVDDEISAMLDNQVENMFLNWLSKAIAQESDEKPLAALNMDKLLQKFLMQKFDQRTVTSPELKEDETPT